MAEPSILIVEDSPPDAKLAKLALSRDGSAAVEHCATLGEAIERLGDPRREPPLAVLLDLTLPDSVGDETFDRLAALGPPPVIILSGDDDPDRALALIERGAQDYLVKGQNSNAAIARAVRQAVERDRLHEALREARDQAQVALRSQQAFVAAMSHEVRTPLTAILGMAELLVQTPLEPEQREYVEIQRRCARALKGLLDNALELSRLESGGIRLAREPFAIEAVVEECLEAFAFAAHPKGVTLFADFADDALGTVVGDEARLRQVLFNLVGNAVKFTEQGRVVVHVRSGDAGLVIEVSDTGIGIPAERQAAVFERFVQAESGITRRYGGSGLGLALCRELVEAMGGSIALESEPERGSTFRVTLPLPVAQSLQPASLAGRRVLVRIADTAERRSLVGRLRRRGAEVREAERIVDVAARLDASRYDAVLLDMRVPEAGALELLEREDLAARPSFARVLLLPMNQRVGDLARCRAAGVTVLGKPARWESLERALRGEAVEPQPAVSARPPSLAGRRILLAEDAIENRTILERHLKPTGCSVVVAEDGEQAVARHRIGEFDLVLMDLHMPRMDGIEATRRIRAEEQRAGSARVPIVALTADAMPEQRQAFRDAGCDAHLGKPFTREELYGLVARLLRDDAPAGLSPEEMPQVPEDLADLADEYLANRCQDALALAEAVRAGRFDDARRRGHNMKGSGGGYGFPRISELGARIEQAAKDGEASRVERLAAELGEYARKLRRALTS